MRDGLRLSAPAGAVYGVFLAKGGVMVWIKRCILLGLSPLTVSLTLLAAGVVCLWSGRRPRLGRWLCVAGLALVTWAGLGFSSRAYLARLESRYAPLDLATAPASTVARLRYVLVLGAGHVSDPRLPATSQLGGASLHRLVEGIRLHRQLPGSRLILTGGPGLDKVPNAEVVAAVARDLGVAQANVIVVGQPRDTFEEAASVRDIVGTAPFVLVTSAAHMPRAMRVFGDAGLHPVPAPTDYGCPAGPGRDPDALFPTSGGLACTERAFYEAMAALQEAVRRWWR